MDNFNQREYQTVIFGALLHDVGKGTGFGLGKYELCLGFTWMAQMKGEF